MRSAGGVGSVVLLAALVGCADNAPPLVLCAASAEPVISAIHHAQTPLRVSAGASAAVARQLRMGQSCDLVVVVDERNLHGLEQRLGEVVPLASNRLVMVSRRSPVLLSGSVPEGRGVIADPDIAPLGAASMEVLTRLGWDGMPAQHVIRASDARSALRVFAAGEAEWAVLYASDARELPAHDHRTLIPSEWHRPVRYVASVVDGSQAGAVLLQRLQSPAGSSALRAHGLEPVHGH